MIEFSEQGQSVPQLYHAHLFFDTSNVEMPLLHEQFVIAREQHECDSVSSDTIEVTLGYALLSKLPEDTEDMTSRHLKDLFPKSMRISVVSITLDNGPCTVMRVKVLERDGSSSDVVVKFLLNEQSYINGFQSRLATEPMRADRAYSCLSESVPRLVAGPTNPEKDGVVFWPSEVVAVMVYDSASVLINSPFVSVGENGDRDSYNVVLGSEIMPVSAGRLVGSFEHGESSLSLMGGSIVLNAMALYNCGAVSGGSAVFGGHGTRSVESPVKYGSTEDDTSEAVEEGEGVAVEYLDAASSTWISVEVPELDDIGRFSSFSEVTVKVPEAAWSEHFAVRIIQPIHPGETYDVFALDNVEVVSYTPNGQGLDKVDLQVASGEMCENGGTCRALTPLEASVVIGGEMGNVCGVGVRASTWSGIETGFIGQASFV
jgi:hypothetical protein